MSVAGQIRWPDSVKRHGNLSLCARARDIDEAEDERSRKMVTRICSRKAWRGWVLILAVYVVGEEREGKSHGR